jgi:hypothetical protein
MAMVIIIITVGGAAAAGIRSRLVSTNVRQIRRAAESWVGMNNQINLFVSAASQVSTGKGVNTCSKTAATKITAT